MVTSGEGRLQAFFAMRSAVSLYASPTCDAIQITSQETALVTIICRRIERGFAEMDGKLLNNREMRKVTNDQKSEWCSVISGVLEGSVLASVMFLVYINYMIEGVNSYMSICI